MPAPALIELTPAALVARLGRKSALARMMLPTLVAAGVDLPSLAVPANETQLERIARSPAFRRWQKEFELSSVPAGRLIFAAQLYTLLTIYWLGELLLRHLAPKTPREIASPFVPDELVEFATNPPASLAAVFDHCREVISEFKISPASLGVDYFKTFYQQLLPREVRHALGEYYTPDWLAEYLLDLVLARQPLGRIVDPACGSGTFLLHVIRQRKAVGTSSAAPQISMLDNLLRQVVGIDVNPLAVAAARLNYALAIADLIPPGEPLPRIPVYLADSILLSDNLAEELGRFEVVVGNPPWVGWETLPADYRLRTRDLWFEQGLFAHSGMSAILGSGKKDLSMLLSCVATDRLLTADGWLAFLTTQAVFKTSAGAGFRRFQIGTQKSPVGIAHVEDLSAVQPFPGATNRTVLFLWQKGVSTKYPVPYFVWKPLPDCSPRLPDSAALPAVLRLVEREECAAEPAAADQPNSTWLTLPAVDRRALHKLVGASAYRAHEGANTGGANAVFWLEKLAENDATGTVLVRNIIAGAKRVVPQVEVELEPDLLYPLIRGSDVRRWRAQPSAWLLLAQDPVTRRGMDSQTLRHQLPKTYAYLQQFETMLRGRAAYRRYFERKQVSPNSAAPFYSMFDVGPYTLAPCKVVWHRMLAPVQAAVIESAASRPAIPQETLAFIPCAEVNEAHFLCGLLNSELFNRAAAAYSQAGGKSFASPHLLTHLYLPRFDAADARHQSIAAEAQRLAAEARTLSAGRKVHLDQSALDQLTAELWL